MSIEIKFAETRNEIQKWNQLVLESPCASFFTISHWFDSYTSFGMRSKYILASTAKGDIVGGAALSVFSLGPMTWIQVPHGPVVISADEKLIEDIVQAIEEYAFSLGAFLVEFLPFEPCLDHEALNKEAEGFNLTYYSDILSEANLGISRYLEEHGYLNISYINVFRSPRQGQIVNLTQDDLLMSFRKGTRRDIRYSLASGVRLIQADSVEELHTAYHVFRENGERQGYSVRPWQTFKKPLITAMHSSCAMVLMAEYQSEVLSAIVLGFGGKRGAYIMGGSRRQNIDRTYPAHFLQYNAMLETMKRGYLEYDLTAIGNVGDGGVAVFKRGFRPNYYRLVGSYTKVFRPRKLHFFLTIQPWLTRNRRRIARMVSIGKALFVRS